MIITRETDYALRILRALSFGGRLTVGELAEKESVPQQFAYKILKKMNHAGFVSITRGADGGCMLAADLKKLSLFDLVEVLEANARLSSCMNPGYQCEWRKKNGGTCTAHMQLGKIQAEMDALFRARTIHWILFGEA